MSSGDDGAAVGTPELCGGTATPGTSVETGRDDVVHGGETARPSGDEVTGKEIWLAVESGVLMRTPVVRAEAREVPARVFQSGKAGVAGFDLVDMEEISRVGETEPARVCPGGATGKSSDGEVTRGCVGAAEGEERFSGLAFGVFAFLVEELAGRSSEDAAEVR